MSSDNKFTDFLKKLNTKIGKFFSDVKNDQKTRTLTIVVAAVIVLGIVLIVLLKTSLRQRFSPTAEMFRRRWVISTRRQSICSAGARTRLSR